MLGENISDEYLLSRDFIKVDHGPIITYTKKINADINLEVYSTGTIALESICDGVENEINLTETHTTQKQIDLLIQSFKII